MGHSLLHGVQSAGHLLVLSVRTNKALMLLLLLLLLQTGTFVAPISDFLLSNPCKCLKELLACTGCQFVLKILCIVFLAVNLSVI